MDSTSGGYNGFDYGLGAQPLGGTGMATTYHSGYDTANMVLITEVACPGCGRQHSIHNYAVMGQPPLVSMVQNLCPLCRLEFQEAQYIEWMKSKASESNQYCLDCYKHIKACECPKKTNLQKLKG